MSEAAPERTTRPDRTRAGGNFFTKKYGPLPGWGWIALGAAGGGVFIWWRKRQAANTAASTAAAATPADTTGSTDLTGQSAATIQSEVQQLQGASSEQEQDITQQGVQEKQLATSEQTQAAINKSQGEAIQDINQGEKGEKPPAKRPPPKRPPPKRPAPRRKPPAGGQHPPTPRRKPR